MAAAIPAAAAIPPGVCRRVAEERFSPVRIVGDYARVFRDVIRHARPDAAANGDAGRRPLAHPPAALTA
jgi:hypothetical protein